MLVVVPGGSVVIVRGGVGGVMTSGVRMLGGVVAAGVWPVTGGGAGTVTMPEGVGGTVGTVVVLATISSASTVGGVVKRGPTRPSGAPPSRLFVRTPASSSNPTPSAMATTPTMSALLARGLRWAGMCGAVFQNGPRDSTSPEFRASLLRYGRRGAKITPL